MFNQTNTPVTIRMAQASDKKIETSPAPTVPTPVKVTPPAPVQPKEQPPVVEQKTEPKPEIKTEEKSETKKNADRIETDQEKMVLELFDGKYVE